MSLAALMGIDKERYDQGNKFLSQDPYLQNFQGRAPITFNESPVMNQGIMGPRIYPYPVIPQGDGGDGGGINPFGGLGKGVTADATAEGGYNLNPDGTAFNSPEVEAEIAAARNKSRLSQAAQLGLFALNPLGYLMGKVARKGIGMVKNKFFGGDGDGGGDGFDQAAYDAGKASAAAQEKSNRDYARGGGDGDGGSTSGSTGTMSASDFSDDTAGTPFQYGGRVGYSGGGLSTYEIFKLGELGFDTKGGTVTAPFGGIKVLRDILKVNQYAGGGIVGLYR